MASKKYFVDINLQSNKVDNLKADTLDITDTINNPASANTKRIVYWSGVYYYSDGVNWIAMSGYVPYTGATQNVNLGEYGLTAGQISLDTSPTGTPVVSSTYWNNAYGITQTLLGGGNVTLKNGVDLVARVVNKVTPNQTLTKASYQVVRVSGAQGQRLAVELAQANNDNNSADTLGVVIETIPTNQEGFIMTVGQLDGINTTGSLQGETWNDGDVLYLSPTTAGAITNIKPTGLTGHIVVLGYVEYAHPNNGKIYVKIMNGWELSELHDCYINPLTLANNNVLAYDSTAQLWENKTITTVIGYTPANQSTTISTTSPLSGGGDLSTNRTLSISQANGSTNGYLSSADWTTFNSKVSSTTTITINGTSQDLSTNRTFTVTDANLSTSDITTNDVSITKHGFAPKLPNDATKYLDGTGNYSVPASGGGTDILQVQVFS